MEVIGQMTGGVAHDFNNLLTAVLGNLELASRREKDDTIRRYLDGATQAAQRGAKITSQLLAMICWKDSPETARAITAAMPLRIRAKHIVITAIEESKASTADAAAVARQLAWHGIRSKAQTIKVRGQPITTLLSSAAKDCAADLLVMGGYGTGLLRQTIFGGCTQSVLEHADVPVFLLH
jgi:nucleotide-binding universal stress UspA family protein